MSSPKKKSPANATPFANGRGNAFTRLRIIGEKAQKLFLRAREGRGNDGGGEPSRRLPPHRAVPTVTIHLSVSGMVQATFVILAIAVGVLVLYLLQDKIVLFLLAVFVAVIVDPGVKLLGRMGIPRGVAMLLQYFIALFLAIFLLISLIPVVADQIQQLGAFLNARVNAFLLAPSIQLPLFTPEVNLRLTDLLKTVLAYMNIERLADALQTLGRNLSVPADSLLFAMQVAGSALNFFLNLIVVLVLAFFMQLEKEKIVSWVRSFLPWSLRLYVDDKSELIHWKLAQWTRGQLLLCFSVTVLVFLALVILRMPYALTLAILAGFTELIPVIGIFIAAVPAVVIALTQQGLLWAVMLALIYYVIQWCESNLLVPLVMKRTIGLSPIVILLAMLIGISFPSIVHPILGIMLSIPIATVLMLFFEDWRETRMKRTR
ncbi:MAG: AI-2E family transporter [Candidatus Peribacteraceae bacterium]|jgi:predicted PurR-regulated permease PerM